MFGKWIQADSIAIVFGRGLFATLAIGLLCQLKNHSLAISKKQVRHLLLSGLLLAVHWWSFFYTIQISTVTLGLITFACFPVFVCLLEPALGQRFSVASQAKVYRHPPLNRLLQAGLCLFGVGLVVYQGGNINVSFVATLTGLLSAFSFALLTLFNRQVVQSVNPLTISFFQNLFAALLLLPLFSFIDDKGLWQDWLLIALLGVIFTALAHTLLIGALRQVTAFSASLTVSLEPIYGTAAAVLLLNESITMSIFVGASLVLGVNLWATMSDRP